MTRNIIFIIIMIAASASFYNPLGIVNPQLAKFVFYAVSLILILWGNRNNTMCYIKHFPIKSYKMILYGMLGACVMAYFFQEQNFTTSLVAILPYFFGYLSLYVFVKSGLTESQVIKIVFGLLIVSLLIYVVNTITYPRMFFGSSDGDGVDDSRGMLRLGVGYIELYMFMLLYSINKWLCTKKYKWIAVAVICLVMIVFSLTRQVIALSIIFATAYLLRKLVWYKKVFFLALTICFAIFVVPEIPIYKAMVEVSVKQKEDSAERDDPRVRCFKFYTDTYQTNTLTRIFGNGIPSIGNSKWGNKFEIETRNRGTYSSDLGWIGFYWHFGLFSALGMFLLLLKTAILKKNETNTYLSYYSCMIIFLAVLSAPILIYKQVISIMLIVYYTYITQNKLSICKK